MKHISSLAEAPAVLETMWPARGALHRMSLDRMREIMDYLGNPQDTYKVVHIAGTSGKTSTAYYTAALLKAAGKRTGLTVSPHVEGLQERVQIDMTPLPETVFVREINTFMEQIVAGGLHPTYFELLCAFAFWEFARQRVEYAVVEVGVGGLLDNTNVISRSDKVCVLTDIGFDHMSVLGSTLPEIAAQKAGIIQLHNPVFCWKQPEPVLRAFRAAARQKQADLHTIQAAGSGVDVAFLPLFQRRNMELALHVVRFLLKRDGGRLTRSGVLLAAHTQVPARMEMRQIAGKTVILDGSHNPQKLHTLMESVHARFPGIPVAVLAGFAKSKTPEHRTGAGARELLSAEHIIVTAFTVNRARPHPSEDPAGIARTFKAAEYGSFEIVPDPEVAFRALLERPEPVVVVTGSFYLLNAIRPVLPPQE